MNRYEVKFIAEIVSFLVRIAFFVLLPCFSGPSFRGVCLVHMLMTVRPVVSALVRTRITRLIGPAVVIVRIVGLVVVATLLEIFAHAVAAGHVKNIACEAVAGGFVGGHGGASVVDTRA